jgi:peroxiredoxin Q/BCP
MMAIEEGKAAPAFSLPDAVGNKVSLKEFRGKNVILYFYPKIIPPAEPRRPRDSVTCMANSKNSTPLSWVSPLTKEHLTRNLLTRTTALFRCCATRKKMMTQYDAFGEKKMYGKVTMGVIRYTVWVGPDGKVKKHWPKVTNAADHPAKVLELMQSALE